ncbi:hypothetical protein ACSDR0_46910 [Streptosporangium sp. G11]|uniref:hypothetical protein n=1 Tax=Streptosporangium sp. G11 TaxID=3436926 RepID=UPI003EB84DE0
MANSTAKTAAYVNITPTRTGLGTESGDATVHTARASEQTMKIAFLMVLRRNGVSVEMGGQAGRGSALRGLEVVKAYKKLGGQSLPEAVVGQRQLDPFRQRESQLPERHVQVCQDAVRLVAAHGVDGRGLAKVGALLDRLRDTVPAGGWSVGVSLIR